MHVPDAAVAELRTRGYALVEGFVRDDEVAAAQEALWQEFPRPEEYFDKPAEYPDLAGSQFAGLRTFPFAPYELNRLVIHPDLVDFAERFLGTSEIELYNAELWAKYEGASLYDQPHHRDYHYQSLVVPRADGWSPQMTAFLFLGDVDEGCGPTRLVPLGDDVTVPYVPPFTTAGALQDVELSMTGPAGSLFIYRTDVLHRGSHMAGRQASRFLLRADYQHTGRPWAGALSFPALAYRSEFVELLERANARERSLFGFPPPGSEYWNAQTIADTGARYPRMEMGEYTAALCSARPDTRE